MAEIALVDSSALLASIDRRDRYHAASNTVLRRTDLHFVVPGLVVAEVAYHAAKRFGSAVEARFIKSLPTFQVEMPSADEWLRVGELITQYSDFPLGTVDASVVVLAERLGSDLIVTLDRRHFGAIRPEHVAAFRILPE